MIQVTFGNRVKSLRNYRMISQLELSILSGIDRTQISKIESGKINVTLETIDKLSRALNIPISTLLNFNNDIKIRPFVKWAGGKTQILDKIEKLMPKEYNRYFEPFIGGGALLFHLTPKEAYINDSNEELVSVYKCLQNDEMYLKLLEKLNEHEENHNEDYFYEIREMDRDENFKKLPLYERAARMIYLNKSCFNGLYRVNSKGYFNVPSAKRDKVNTYDRKNMPLLKQYFTHNKIYVTCTDFEEAVINADKGDFVYFDPPYDTLDDKNSFTSYSKVSFGKGEQARLAHVYKDLSSRGVNVMLSNHNTQYINELYKEFNIHIINAKRMINSKGDGRGEIEEVIITNY